MYFFMADNSDDKIGMRKKPHFYQYIDEAILAKKKETIFEAPNQKLRRYVKKYMACPRTFKPEKKRNVYVTLLKMHIFRFYLTALVMWVYINILIHYYSVKNWHFDKNRTSFFDRYYCYHNSHDRCLPVESYWFSKVIYFAGLLLNFMMVK